MKIAAMQPYLFPYLGYFQLIAVVDRFVVSDGYQYRRHGWINRNSILMHGQPHLFILPVRRASYRLPINQRYFMGRDDRERRLRNFAHAYGRAPHVEETLSLIEGIFGFSDLVVARFIDAALRRVCDNIKIRTPFTLSSALNLDPPLSGIGPGRFRRRPVTTSRYVTGHDGVRHLPVRRRQSRSSLCTTVSVKWRHTARSLSTVRQSGASSPSMK